MVAVHWGNSAISLVLEADEDGPVRLTDIRLVGMPARDPEEAVLQPLVEVMTDQWTAVAFETEAETLLIAWRQQDALRALSIDLAHLPDEACSVEQLYPPAGVGEEWTVSLPATRLEVECPAAGPAARMFRIGHATG